jgi:hypothetical protein
VTRHRRIGDISFSLFVVLKRPTPVYVQAGGSFTDYLLGVLPALIVAGAIGGAVLWVLVGIARTELT